MRYVAEGYPDDSNPLIRTARRRVPADVRDLLDRHLVGSRRQLRSRILHRALRSALHAMPVPPATRDYIAAQDPDVVVVAPSFLLGLVGDQETVRAAQELSVPTALCVASWDNLRHRQLIDCDPHVTLVWNDVQRQEAIEVHGLPADRVVATGAQVYDQWFDRRPSDRAAFCERAGLPDDRPFVLYVGGALFSRTMTESQFVERWVAALRASLRPELRDTAVLVRPHPSRIRDLGAVDLDAYPGVSVWPRHDQMPVAHAAKQDFFDSLHHSAAVVGVNTSAMIEAGIAGKRVFAVLVPELSESQFETLHFRYLTQAGGGLLRVAELAEHLDDLANTLSGAGDPAEENRPFLEAFVRPHGLHVPATPMFVDAIERVAATRPKPVRSGPAELALRWAFEPLRVAYELEHGRAHRRRMIRARLARNATEL
ncbi:MAG: hypothetical protein M3445_03970 [Actinomycetota bacterium]|nr:hypothetical protein [Actinomycetota bacterium]